MIDFFSWEGWEAVSSICQVFMSIFAFIAICITIKQISSKSKAKLGMSFKVGLGVVEVNEETQIIPGFSMQIVNLGMAPVYITECGIEISKSKNSNPGLYFSMTPFVLQPGECEIKSMTHFRKGVDDIEDKISLRDTVKMFVVDGAGKTYYKKTGYDYESLKFEFEKMEKRANKGNESR